MVSLSVTKNDSLKIADEIESTSLMTVSLALVMVVGMISVKFDVVIVHDHMVSKSDFW